MEDIINIAIIQARMNSERLPGKVLMDLCGQTVLDHVYNRVKRSKLVDIVYVATGLKHVNNLIVEHCIKNGYNYYLGEPDNVLKRYYDLASIISKNPKDNIIRITADCPLIDSYIIDQMILNMMGEYMTNQKTYIDGYDVEIIKKELLDSIYRLYYYDEHVTLKFKQNNPQSIKYHDTPKNLHDVHLSLDTQEDYNRINDIYKALYNNNHYFGYEDVVRYLGL